MNGVTFCASALLLSVSVCVCAWGTQFFTNAPGVFSGVPRRGNMPLPGASPLWAQSKSIPKEKKSVRQTDRRDKYALNLSYAYSRSRPIIPGERKEQDKVAWAHTRFLREHYACTRSREHTHDSNRKRYRYYS